MAPINHHQIRSLHGEDGVARKCAAWSWHALAALAAAIALLAGLPSGLAQEGEPILCLNDAGHTAGVRALAFSPDSKRLYSAGMDKVVYVWRLPDLVPDTAGGTKGAYVEPWSRESAIRWEIGRGLRGSIYSLALAPRGDLLAIAGYGARGTSGEIIRLDPRSGTFQPPCRGHLQSIAALAFSADGEWLASMDLAGQAMVWPSGGKEPVRLTRPDAETYQKPIIEFLARRPFRPLAAVGTRLVALPQYVTADRGVAPEIVLYRATTGQRERVLAAGHEAAIRALAASADGRWLASADERGNLCLSDLTAQDAATRRLQQALPVISLAFSPGGEVLLAGTAVPQGKAGSQLQVWSVPKRTLQQTFPLEGPVYAAAASPDGKRIAYSGAGGNDIVVRRLDRAEEPLLLKGGQAVLRAAFAGQGSRYTFCYQLLGAGGAAPARRFDPAALQPPVRTPAPAGVQGTVPGPQSQGDWRGALDRAHNGVEIHFRNRLLGIVALDAEKQGVAETFCWVPDEDGQAEAVAVGSDLQCGVYLYGLSPPSLPLPLLRYFRGHHDAVTSLAVSADRKYLLSGSRDGTIRYWPLAGYRKGRLAAGRWGAELAPDGQRLVLASMDDLGPLWAKGVRPGDLVTKIVWPLPQAVREATAPKEILAALEQLPWDAQVGFFTSRDNRPRPPFNCVGAWQQSLAVHATQHDDWIAWTPAGYYACSAGGERLIGWQINRGLGEKPLFFTAEQFSKKFYRPDAIRDLLEKGSLRAALGGSGKPLVTLNDALPPIVRIVTPAATRSQQEAAETVVTAEATGQPGSPVTRMWLSVDGAALGALSTTKETSADGARSTKTWRVPLGPGEHRIVACAESDVSQGQSEVATIVCTGKKPLKPCLYVLSIGASSYPGRWKLKYADSDAAQVAAVFEHNGRPVFDRVEIRSLLNQQATKAGILEGLQWLKARLALRRNPEDVAVVFFSGHGWADETGRFFLLPIDGPGGGAGQAGPAQETIRQSCVSAEAIKQFCQEALPCRLAIFLDACRSGAADVAGLAKVAAARDDLGRQLARSDCGVVLIASSKGNQDSREDDALRAGFFTKALVDGLRGKACFVDQDLVFMPHIYLYVAPAVSAMTQGQQDPVLNFDNPFTPQIRFVLTKRSP
jgi:WD40 repeat protein